MDGLRFRRAVEADLPVLVALLADDDLGRGREVAGARVAPEYVRAFADLDADPHQELIVGDRGDRLVAMLQLTFIPGLSRQGAWRAQVEAVRVHPEERSRGVGRALMEHAIERARVRGCRLVQLTTDRQRQRAHAFYERLGFAPTHVGMKLALDP